MTPADLRRLATVFGSAAFTSAQAHAQLDAGFGSVSGRRAFACALRAAVGRSVRYGERTVSLEHAGTVHGNLRRWVFTPSATAPIDPDGDLL